MLFEYKNGFAVEGSNSPLQLSGYYYRVGESKNQARSKKNYIGPIMLYSDGSVGKFPIIFPSDHDLEQLPDSITTTSFAHFHYLLTSNRFNPGDLHWGTFRTKDSLIIMKIMEPWYMGSSFNVFERSGFVLNDTTIMLTNLRIGIKDMGSDTIIYKFIKYPVKVDSVNYTWKYQK